MVALQGLPPVLLEVVACDCQWLLSGGTCGVKGRRERGQLVFRPVGWVRCPAVLQTFVCSTPVCRAPAANALLTLARRPKHVPLGSGHSVRRSEPDRTNLDALLPHASTSPARGPDLQLLQTFVCSTPVCRPPGSCHSRAHAARTFYTPLLPAADRSKLCQHHACVMRDA